MADKLFAVRNTFYLGGYQSCISECRRAGGELPLPLKSSAPHAALPPLLGSHTGMSPRRRCVATPACHPAAASAPRASPPGLPGHRRPQHRTDGHHALPRFSSPCSAATGLSDAERIERDVYLYRSYIELGTYDVRTPACHAMTIVVIVCACLHRPLSSLRPLRAQLVARTSGR